MKRLIGIALAIALGTTGTAFAQGTGTEVMVGVDASEWTSDTVLDIPGGIFPVGGGGQLNGEFTIVTRDGSEIGLRATDRVDGLLTATGMRKGFYTASTGYDTGTTNRAEWNYDIHVDLRGTGTELSDYDLTLNQTFVNKLLGSAGPFDLTFPDFTFGVLVYIVQISPGKIGITERYVRHVRSLQISVVEARSIEFRICQLRAGATSPGGDRAIIDTR